MNINELMRQAQRMQGKIEKVRKEAGEQTVEGSDPSGMVVVVMSGNNEVKSVTIKPDAVDPDDIDMLQDLVLAATNDAVQKAAQMMQDELKKVTGGMPIPGMM